jgi:putative ATP-dependent endonuclease of OLD family
MHLSHVVIENFRCFGEEDARFELHLSPGLTALVGENDAGKTAVMDAIRIVLGTTDQDWYRLEDDDFHNGDTSREIRIVCKFEDLGPWGMRAFAEYLTYADAAGSPPILYVNWTAKNTGQSIKGIPYRRAEIRSGKDGAGPPIVAEARARLRATYLRPLRDAEQALSAGRGSRLAQVLHHAELVRNSGVPFDSGRPLTEVKLDELSVLGIGELANALLESQKGVVDTRGKIDGTLQALTLHGDALNTRIKVSGTDVSPEVRLRQLLEKLDLSLVGQGRLGLGSDNLLFMACELLLLEQEDEDNKMLLIEEPEAHLHVQRQLQVMKALQQQADEKRIQIIVSTHSPNLASVINLDNIVVIRDGAAFSMKSGVTELDSSDYRFLERFLDATKANLFFARGVVIVEGDAENILLPELATLIGRDFTKYGVSIVNVGGVGLRRYARIFQRKAPASRFLDVPVACITDMDVMPDCAPAIVEKKLKDDGSFPEKRRWLVKADFVGEGKPTLLQRREALRKKASGQFVETFVADEWTLEYDLAYYGLAKYVYVAAHLAIEDERATQRGEQFDGPARSAEFRKGLEEYKSLEATAQSEVDKDVAMGSSMREVLASKVYAKVLKTSKPLTAQYLSSCLRKKSDNASLMAEDLRQLLPPYLVNAIDFVTTRGKTS